MANRYFVSLCLAVILLTNIVLSAEPPKMKIPTELPSHISRFINSRNKKIEPLIYDSMDKLIIGCMYLCTLPKDNTLGLTCEEEQRVRSNDFIIQCTHSCVNTKPKTKTPSEHQNGRDNNTTDDTELINQDKPIPLSVVVDRINKIYKRWQLLLH